MDLRQTGFDAQGSEGATTAAGEGRVGTDRCGKHQIQTPHSTVCCAEDNCCCCCCLPVCARARPFSLHSEVYFFPLSAFLSHENGGKYVLLRSDLVVNQDAPLHGLPFPGLAVVGFLTLLGVLAANVVSKLSLVAVIDGFRYNHIDEPGNDR